MSAPTPLILVGNPNVGKSVIFSLLTGKYVTVSNYPGTTVEVTRGRVPGADSMEVIDTPGVNSLMPQSEEEQVTRDILLREAAGSVLQVGDQKNLARTLFISLQIAEAGRPFVLCLNMGDEAADRGVSVDAAALSADLGVDVVCTTATRREGTGRLLPLARAARASKVIVRYDPRIEEAIARVEPLLPPCGITARSLALMVLAGDTTLGDWLNAQLGAGAIASIEEVRHRLQRQLTRSPAWVINEQRQKAAASMARRVTTEQEARSGRLAAALGAAAVHPVWGVPVMLLVLWAMFVFVGQFGAGTAVDLMETELFGKQLASLRLQIDGSGGVAAGPEPQSWDTRLRPLGGRIDPRDGTLLVALEERAEGGEAWQPVTGRKLQALAGSPPRPVSPPPVETAEPGIFKVAAPRDGGMVEVQAWSGLLNPALQGLLRAWLPWESAADFFVGRYGLITMGLTYAVAIVLPIIITFFFAFSLLEDSGYLPRLAAMLNRVFRVMGLNGKAVLPMVLGLGCDTMATLTSRILDSRKERMIAILLLALGVPCSAQLGVTLGLLAGLSWVAAAIWVGVVIGVLLLVGFLASRIIRGTASPFILELPPLRVPSAGNIASKTMARTEWYLKEAVPLFLIGTAFLFVAHRTGGLLVVERLFEPVVTGILGLPASASEALIVGFLRRDFGAAGLFRLADEGMLSPVQIVVALVTITLFIPCIANLLMIIKEQGARVGALVAAFVFPFAIAVGGILNFILTTAGVTL